MMAPKSPAMSLLQLNRHTIRSHYLGRKAAGGDLVRVVDRLCGLNAQTARAPYLSLWSRIEGFSRNDLEQAFIHQRRLIKTWLMRGTVHMVPTREFFIYHKALRDTFGKGWLRELSRRGLLLPERTRKRLHQEIVGLLSSEPRTKNELFSEIQRLLKGHDRRQQKRYVGLALRELSYRGLVCHGESTGPWYHFREHRFETVDNWIGGQDVVDPAEDEAQHQLLVKYLRGYGPASAGDFAYWTGLKMTVVKKLFTAAQAQLEPIEVEGQRAPLWILKEDAARLRDRAREIDGEASLPVRFLPEFDSLVMGHRDKSRILDEIHRKKVFLRLADVAPAFLVDGRVAGTWGYRMTTGKMEIHPFRRWKTGSRKRVADEADHLKSFFRCRE
jgi:hypothetical protein